MSQNERIYKIDQLLNNHTFVTIPEFLDRLEVSLATFKRDIAYMRDRLNAPIEFNRDLGGYQMTKQTLVGDRYELPGLWFSSEEIYALITMQQLLQNLDGSGLLGGHIKPLLSRLQMILNQDEHVLEDIEQRIKVKNVGYRKFQIEHFPLIATATIKSQKINIIYQARSTDAETQRTVSPQRINYYKGNWYLEAWCHVRNGMRIFSMDCINTVELLNEPCQQVAQEDLEKSEKTYGIFSGADIQWAQLKFTPAAARWVKAEVWHSDQKQSILEDGSLILEVPYSDQTEMLMDILRHGANVKVIAPYSLANSVKNTYEMALLNYLST
ncbi:MAG: YafY family transcriptional regulator [Methylophilus methylotrophus]|uniref:YafY family transcriptional regulator n=1 Tax=Methylophilus methylotrophus TaxID=17 RepID=A0A5C7WI40_METME|nr:MAG: YafY family transcriptional regulator [Methylophilus methylotrophus]